MYLSRVEIDLTNRQKTKELSHLGAYHNLVERSFSWTEATSARPRHLWRLDQLRGRLFLLVLSDTQPDLAVLGQYGSPRFAQTKDYAPFLATLQGGQQMQFRLTANPTYAAPQPDGARGRVYPHVTVAQQRQWLAERADRLGFALGRPGDDPDRAFDLVSRDHPVMRHRGTRAVRMSRVSYEGLLTITDLAVFKQTLVTGIGREKAYGMGLMTVIPG
ncbi:type I-E CRISPR-associated protein Cas6/Cse3/CasE [Lacticaseibacillus absianus]|uniref:type I-E CRISPR-associated protein Cas6/Cse3/CasE n=1 Tax=Lacticaseibacillus absianus TaxID=2729623 RepID=UPI0015CCC63E|nr:type I-E CRISPR-associated protein Cas6/Cse3/CasE [Lacticaseibacillus absianus]